MGGIVSTLDEPTASGGVLRCIQADLDACRQTEIGGVSGDGEVAKALAQTPREIP